MELGEGVESIFEARREQQRIAFARVLYNRPALVFLDEATSATDEGLEHMLYSLLREALPDSMLVSVGHRSTLDAFHTHRLELDGAGGWTMSVKGVGCYVWALWKLDRAVLLSWVMIMLTIAQKTRRVSLSCYILA